MRQTLALHLMRPLATDTRTLASIARIVPVVDADAPAARVDDLFRRDPSLPTVVVRTETADVLLTRGRIEAHLAGRLGYGRAVWAQRTIRSMLPRHSLTLPGDSALPVAAAAAVLDRAEHDHDDQVIVSGVAVGRDRAAVVGVEELLQALAAHFARQSLIDPLTGLGNRLLLSQLCEDLGDHVREATLIAVDLDRFKPVNDRYGHAAGDLVLVEFARRLAAVVGDAGGAVRLGGDEFAVLLPDPAPGEAAMVAARILDAAAEAITVADTEVSVGASIGIATAAAALEHHRGAGTGVARPGDGAWVLDTMLRAADTAVYTAKRSGRSQVVDVSGGTAADQRSRLVNRVAAAVADGELPRALRRVYQPIRYIETRAVRCVEALTRWHDTELGEVHPGELFAVLEQTGAILDVSRWVLEGACRDAVTAGPDVMPMVSVNISPLHLIDRRFCDDVEGALRRSGLEPGRLALEITETAAVTDESVAAVALARLRDLGISIALDDFGTGASSLTLLQSLPFDVIKIDRRFVTTAATDERDAALVRFLCDVVHSLGRRVCAEGVETEAQLDYLSSIGCDTAQGWLLGRPAAVEELPGADSAAARLGGAGSGGAGRPRRSPAQVISAAASSAGGGGRPARPSAGGR